jgi:hypothetical protein
MLLGVLHCALTLGFETGLHVTATALTKKYILFVPYKSSCIVIWGWEGEVDLVCLILGFINNSTNTFPTAQIITSARSMIMDGKFKSMYIQGSFYSLFGSH